MELSMVSPGTSESRSMALTLAWFASRIQAMLAFDLMGFMVVGGLEVSVVVVHFGDVGILQVIDSGLDECECFARDIE